MAHRGLSLPAFKALDLEDDEVCGRDVERDCELDNCDLDMVERDLEPVDVDLAVTVTDCATGT